MGASNDPSLAGWHCPAPPAPPPAPPPPPPPASNDQSLAGWHCPASSVFSIIPVKRLSTSYTPYTPVQILHTLHTPGHPSCRRAAGEAAPANRCEFKVATACSCSSCFSCSCCSSCSSCCSCSCQPTQRKQEECTGGSTAANSIQAATTQMTQFQNSKLPMPPNFCSSSAIFWFLFAKARLLVSMIAQLAIDRPIGRSGNGRSRNIRAICRPSLTLQTCRKQEPIFKIFRGDSEPKIKYCDDLGKIEDIRHSSYQQQRGTD